MIKFYVIIFFIAMRCTSARALEITFKDIASVSSAYVILGDVVTFDEQSPLSTSLATKVIAKSPPPGESLFINAIEIKKQIVRKNQLGNSTRWAGSSVIKITRAGQQVLPEQLIDSIGSYLKEKNHALPQATISFKPRSLPLPFTLPQGKLSIEVVPSNPSIIKSSRFSLILRVDDKVRKNISIQGDLQVLAKVAVAKGTLKRGAILTPANTAMVVRDLTDHHTPMTNLRAVLGKRLKHTIRDAQVISVEDVEFPPLVRKGQLVKVIYTKGNLHLTATGIARTDGLLDQIIRVKNTSSNKLIHCRVAAPGIVEVKI